MSGLLLNIRVEKDPSDDNQTVVADNVEILGTTFDGDDTSVEFDLLERNGKSRGRPSKRNRGGGRPSKLSRTSNDVISINGTEETILSSRILCGNDHHRSSLHISEHEYNRGALVIDDSNDLVYRLVTVLPMRCWLELGAEYPTGKFYLPGLSVNKLLNITAKNLNDLLASNDSMLGRNGSLSHIIFTHTSFGRLARQDGTRAHWIYLDLTGNRPHEGPGDQIVFFNSYFFSPALLGSFKTIGAQLNSTLERNGDFNC